MSGELARLRRWLVRYQPWLTGLSYHARALSDPRHRTSRRDDLEQCAVLRRELGRGFPPVAAAAAPRRVLVMGYHTIAGIIQEAVLLRAFEAAGYRPTVLAPRHPPVHAAYRLLGTRELRGLVEFLRDVPLARAERLLDRVSTLQELLALEEDGIRVGRFAVSTFMRQSRRGEIDLGDAGVRPSLAAALRVSLESADAMRRAFDRLRPDAILLIDRGYSPSGEMFDLALARGIPAVTWNLAHRADSICVKRYHPGNRDAHPYSLSAESWDLARSMPWTPAMREGLHRELASAYASGDWFAEVGTQLGKRMLGREELARQLGLDPRRKTAVIFPHIFWDATFFWGEDLFDNYEQWFIRTIKAAAANDQLNWIVKVHPANIFKDKRDGVAGEHSEVAAMRRTLGELPPHIRLMTADTPVSTLSLFDVMDFCVTVRGTVGIEAACLGKRVLTAGTGRYDRRGFTVDSDTREQFLARLSSLHTLGPMTDREIELANRFAYASFLCRPLRYSAVRAKYDAAKATAAAEVLYRSRETFLSAADVQGLAAWIATGKDDYFALPALGAGATPASDSTPASPDRDHPASAGTSARP